jgi:hypothetical protein
MEADVFWKASFGLFSVVSGFSFASITMAKVPVVEVAKFGASLALIGTERAG